MDSIKQLFRDQGFLIHFIVYASVNALLFVIDMLTGPDVYWFQWPLLGWGIGLLGHAYLAHQTIERKRAAAAARKAG